MDSFALITHPQNESEFMERFFAARLIPGFLVSTIMKWYPPYRLTDIRGVASRYNRSIGHLFTCPLTSDMVDSYHPRVIKKVISSAKLAKKAGAKIIGLGSRLSLVEGLSELVAREAAVPVTTGNSYRIASLIEALKIAFLNKGTEIENAKVMVVGATCNIGSTCAFVMAGKIRELVITGQDERKTEKLGNQILYDTGLVTKISTQINSPLKESDIVIIAEDSCDEVNPEDFKPGAIVCDIFGRGNAIVKAACERNDVTIIEKTLTAAPEVRFDRELGLPCGMVDSGMVETMILALEKRYHSFTGSSEIRINKVDEINKLARKHGFNVSGFLTKVKETRIKNNLSGKIIVSRTSG